MMEPSTPKLPPVSQAGPVMVSDRILDGENASMPLTCIVNNVPCAKFQPAWSPAAPHTWPLRWTCNAINTAKNEMFTSASQVMCGLVPCSNANVTDEAQMDTFFPTEVSLSINQPRKNASSTADCTIQPPNIAVAASVEFPVQAMCTVAKGRMDNRVTQNSATPVSSAGM